MAGKDECRCHPLTITTDAVSVLMHDAGIRKVGYIAHSEKHAQRVFERVEGICKLVPGARRGPKI